MIETPEQLRWLMESASGEALSNCYILDLPSKSIDITSWTDTGIGACSQPATIASHHESCVDAFCGGLDGNGTAIRFRYAETEGDGAKGGMGLFPCLRGAYVTGLTLDATVDADEPLNGYNSALTGAVCSYAGPLDGTPTVIDGISVTQRFVQRVWSGATNTGKTNSSSWSAGIAGFNDEGSVIQNCTVVNERNLTEAGAPVERNMMWAYFGISVANAGTIESCAFRYAGGDNAVLLAFGGMAYQSTGNVLNCSADVQAQGLFFSGGAILDAMDGGTMSGCTAVVNIEGKDDPEYGTSDTVGGLVGQVFWIAKDKATGDYYLPPSAITIADCTVSGDFLGGSIGVGGIAGLIGVAIAGDNPRISPYSCTVKDCTVKIAEIGTKNKSDSAGGIFGKSKPSSDVTIENCVSYADIYGYHEIGGIFGSVYYCENELSMGTAERPTRFTITNSHNYGKIVSISTGLTAGGIGGILYGWNGYYDTFISGCSSSADVTAGDLVGGLVGMHSVKEQEVKSAGRPYTYYDCHSYGDVSAISTRGEAIAGGFLGLSHKNARNLIVKSCSASGDVYSTATFVGGFLGGDGWKDQNSVNEDAKNSYIDCSASGTVTTEYNSAGGFVGLVEHSPNLAFTGCSATGDVVAKNQFAGGFVGILKMGVPFTDCTASGNVSAKYTAGGFVARSVELTEFKVPGAKYSFTRCYAYGDVKADASSDSLTAALAGSGGFGGNFESGSYVAMDCAAYGSVEGVTVGGFLGRTDRVTSVDFTRCEAYGDLTVNAKAEVGGFAGYLKGESGAAAVITKCAAYGSVKNCDVTQTTWSDCAGFISDLALKATIDGCASYAPSVIGQDACSAAFLTIGDAAANTSVIRNCSYTGFGADKKDKMTQAWGTGSALPSGNLANNKFLGASAAVPANPKTATVGCVKSNDNGQCKITVTFGEGAQYKLKELAVSTDGGKTYTQLVSAGRVVAGVLPESVLTGTNFSYTYRAPFSANFKVRIDAEVTRTVNGEKRTAPFQKIF